MENKARFFIGILLCILFLSSCVDKNKEKTEIDPKINFIGERVKGMSLEEKIGQLFIIGFNGEEIDKDIEYMIKNYYVGGFILFQENIKNIDQTLNLINSLKKANENNNIPLFISTDEEGGKVTRVSNLFGSVPGSREIGEMDNEEYSFKIGDTIGYRLKSIGFNLDFAPVLDIDSNSKNPVIKDRSYGRTKDIVSKHGIQVMKGIKSNNVIPTIKHFPGHGDTFIDSHLDLPAVNKDLEELRKMELIPFKEAIDMGADMVMVGHMLFPKIDSENPATFSKEIITNLLRKDLNYDKVIVTDDMTMGAITKNYNIEKVAIKSLKAGADIILICHSYEDQIKVIESIKEAVKSGEILEKEIDEKVYRIVKLKEEYGLRDDIIESISIEKIDKKMNDLKNIRKR
ncbi:MAG: beta-N-acetylhexosaminidase [Clostridiaceae bacterium]|nr:beta-N-acetylhexosaminidase [Clostridiaceae bacterium]MBW4860722.1 beta-N-acetylhexosaminidase [Clostridiaceae bacterium]MBW4869024.1 beta-N-acetylhexosaminidase [Clostridiaceae bacterium]